MKAKATGGRVIRIQLPEPLFERVEEAARASRRNVSEMIVSALENTLPPLPEDLPLELATDLQRWALLDDEALRAIAHAFLPPKQQRRFTTLLRKAEAGRLNARERAEWESLRQEYLRFSQNKAKAQYLLAQRAQAQQANGAGR
jgi:hypothetical protein